LITVTATGAWTTTVDVAGYEATANPDGSAIDSNPFSLVVEESGESIVSDAGANALLKISPAGAITTLAVFPVQEVEFPPGSGSMIPMQAVPTGLTKGPDGAYYVGQLTGFPFPVGGASVFRVVEGEAPTVVAAGFTNIIDIAFDEDGNLYVLEIDASSLLAGDDQGAVIRITPFGLRETIIPEGLLLPTGMTLGPEDDLYISNAGPVGAGAGEILRFAIPPPRYLIYFPIIVNEGAPAAEGLR
jgi:hypothetical protein